MTDQPIEQPAASKSPHMSIQEAADYWAVSVEWVRKQIADRNLTVLRAGKLIRLRRDEVENLLEEVPS